MTSARQMSKVSACSASDIAFNAFGSSWTGQAPASAGAKVGESGKQNIGVFVFARRREIFGNDFPIVEIIGNVKGREVRHLPPRPWEQHDGRR